jgi:hypothetical protein
MTFVLGIAGRLLRVQCKWASCQGDVVYVRLKSSYHSPTRGYVVTTYNHGEIDAVAVYCGDLGCCYLLPMDLVAGRGVVTLRLRRTRNNQRATLNWATEYELHGAVAQLEERVDGIDEAEGSSPSSSTDQIMAVEPRLEVGAHEFRNRFGYYMGACRSRCRDPHTPARQALRAPQPRPAACLSESRKASRRRSYNLGATFQASMWPASGAWW